LGGNAPAPELNSKTIPADALTSADVFCLTEPNHGLILVADFSAYSEHAWRFEREPNQQRAFLMRP
jgi:hypothetical protein